MTIDVKRGDVLTAKGKDYRVKAVEDWTTDAMNSASFQAMATVDITVKRQPFSASALDALETVYTGKSTPLDPVGWATQQKYPLRSPFEALQTFVADDDEYKLLVLEDLLQ